MHVCVCAKLQIIHPSIHEFLKSDDVVIAETIDPAAMAIGIVLVTESSRHHSVPVQKT